MIVKAETSPIWYTILISKGEKIHAKFQSEAGEPDFFVSMSPDLSGPKLSGRIKAKSYQERLWLSDATLVIIGASFAK